MMDNLDSYLFMLKKFLGGLLTPVPLTLLLLLWALLLLLRKKTRWVGFLFLLAGISLLFATSYAPVSTLITASLEDHYPSYQPADAPADYIAVLGHGHSSAEKHPVSSEISPVGVVRIVEGIRIYRLNPGSKLIFTGYHNLDNDPVSYPDKSKELAIALGVPEEDILSFTGPRDTAEEATLLAGNFSGTKLVLVTSAAHMPRAMLLFKREGLRPLPAPTHHQVKPVTNYWTFPSEKTLETTAYWLHEQVGLLWAEISGKQKKYFQGKTTTQPKGVEK